MEFSAAQIAEFLSGTVEGNPDVKVNTFTKIEEGKPGSLSFLSNKKYTHFLYQTQASIVLINQDFVAEEPVAATLIRVEDAYASLAKLLELVEQYKPKKQGVGKIIHVADTAVLGKDLYIGDFSYIGENTHIGDGTEIYPQVYLGDHVKIGKNCILYPGVKIYNHCIIGNNCILQAGVIIGGDGFGFAPQEDGSYKKIPQIGNVVLEDNVEVCANATIDRATMGSTIIHKGVKMDNLVQVAHNVEIGENTVMAALSGVAGSTKVGKSCIIAGQVGIAGHLHIADGVTIGAKTGIMGDLKDNSAPYFGTPALPVKQYMRAFSYFRKFPDIYNELQQTRKELAELKQKLEKNNG